MPDLNRQGLSEILDIEFTEIRPETPANNNEGDAPEEIIRRNINNANLLLDRINVEILNGNFNARMAEVASLLINSITQAATQIMTHNSNEESLQIKRDVVLLKTKELEIKSRLISNKTSSGEGQDRLVITDRETILKFLQDKKGPEAVKKLVEKTDGGEDDE